jgi:transposase
MFADMCRCANMINKHLDGIPGHWVRGTTNALLEGLNSVFFAVKRLARGFRSMENLITMFYFTAGRFDLPLTN